MKVLVVGSGGREHALVWKIAQSPLVSTILAAPGSAAISELATCHTIPVSDLDGLVDLARAEAVDLVIVGPEVPLCDGLADRLRQVGIATFGPSKLAARLEASKAFAKDFYARHNVPSARYGTFSNAGEAKAFLDQFQPPYVLKADGLAAGKGVVIVSDRAEAEAEIDAFLSGKFGDASRTLVIEEFMDGEEVSIFALCDGEDVLYCGAAQDHKRVGEGDTGPNTGGMGAYSPAPIAKPELIETAMKTIIEPVARGLAAEGSPFQGVLFAGLMVNADGPRVVEFNIRFGDPECQVLMMRIEDDLLPYLEATATGHLADMPPLSWTAEPAITVVMAANGYPDSYEKGSLIEGVDAANLMEGVVVFEAGTGRNAAGQHTATGGRVLNVTASGETLHYAVDRAYAAVDQINWPGGFCRRDIAWRALKTH
ncbi:phosphoribosylamine--glycine ligase [Maricaulis maris]|jgi:phosphoribosylamine--glycine ligase|uniref:Phosphoribosylamine--glycine ligase n=1 Tax=Maricaulis maris (strain MCS10) TaxID=394221 RepID=Q0AS17_MARMM|nr:phosphoribosylamine--glycine ligase [Maricaulis maris]ABI64920.1 phosphoribosylamine--glycine ligase [Maricaulis maris MCS10]